MLLGRVVAIDYANRRVNLDAGRFTPNTDVEFEHLVLAMGGVVDLSRVPGMSEHAFILKNVGDALNLRSAIISRLEEANLVDATPIKAKLLTFVVVGGGYSGVETAGQMLDLIQDVRGLYRNLQGVPARVILVHSGDHLLPDIGTELGTYAEKKLKARGLEIILNARVNAVTAGMVYLEGGRSIESFLVVSTVGNAPHPTLVRFCAEQKIETLKGRIITEPTMQVKGFDHLWAIGDCAAVPVDDQPSSPSTAQYALRQGQQLGKNLTLAIANQPLKKFQFKNLGQLASIGHRTAVANVMGFKFSGFAAWWFWRTVYVWKLPGLQRRLRVIVDWTMELFFRRDISNLGDGPSRMLQEIYLQPGDVLFRSGEPSQSFYIVQSGRIDLMDGEKLFTSLLKGEHFGEWALLNTRHWLFTAIAAEPTHLVAIKRETFKTLSDSSTSFRNLFIQTGGRYVSKTDETVPGSE